MRRESKTENIPFKENLVFYAPLNEGHLEDKISGVMPTTDSGCSCAWNDENGMYLLDASGYDGSFAYALKYTGLDMGFADGDAVTLVIDVKEVSFTGNHYSPMFCTPSAIVESQGWNPARVNNVYYHPTLDTTLHRCCVVCTQKIGYNKFNVIRYEDGIYKHTAQWSAAIKLSDNIVTICQLKDGSTQYSILAKNARIYNRALTAEEVAQL